MIGRRIEIGALLALAFFLPLYEAPKNIAWLVYVIAWVANGARARDFGGRWGGWDWLVAAWIASGFVVAAFAGLHASEWPGAFDLLRYASLVALLRRAGYSAGERGAIFHALVASLVIGLALGHWRLSPTTASSSSSTRWGTSTTRRSTSPSCSAHAAHSFSRAAPCSPPP